MFVTLKVDSPLPRLQSSCIYSALVIHSRNPDRHPKHVSISTLMSQKYYLNYLKVFLVRSYQMEAGIHENHNSCEE